MKHTLITTILALIAITTTACDKDKNNGCKYEDGDYTNLKTSTVTAIAAPVLDVPANVQIVKLIEFENDATFYEGGVFVNDSIKIQLPETVSTNDLYGILGTASEIRKSQNFLCAMAKLEGYDSNGNLLGEFDCYDPADGATIALLFYADRDVTVTGKDNSCDTWRTEFKKGWNFLYFEGTDNGLVMTTTAPGNMVWRFSAK